MINSANKPLSTESVLTALRELYSRCGYNRYKMNKFEEYDLYVRNKDFLVSDNIITFNDLNGRLMALKPDVTLSIIKNTPESGGVRKVYYNENVYRAAKNTRSYREIMQVGLECLGNVDEYCIYEVIRLAAESLKCISENCVLDISHLGIIGDVLDKCALTGNAKKQALVCICEKNAHSLAGLCRENGVSAENSALLTSLVSIYGSPDEAIPQLKALLPDSPRVKELESVVYAFRGSEVYSLMRIDFSVAGNMKYYNGFAFRGFVEGVPDGVLSGGQYDRLMAKMGRNSRAIGFAVYLDLLEDLFAGTKTFDVDTILLYDEGYSIEQINSAVEMLREGGMSVSAQKEIPERMRYRRLAKLENGEVKILGNNA